MIRKLWGKGEYRYQASQKVVNTRTEQAVVHR